MPISWKGKKIVKRKRKVMTAKSTGESKTETVPDTASAVPEASQVDVAEVTHTSLGDNEGNFNAGRAKSTRGRTGRTRAFPKKETGSQRHVAPKKRRAARPTSSRPKHTPHLPPVQVEATTTVAETSGTRAEPEPALVEPPEAAEAPDRKRVPDTSKPKPKPPRRSRTGRKRRTKAGKEPPIGRDKSAASEQEAPAKKTTARWETDEVAEEDAVGGDDVGREMLINVSAGDECRIAVLHHGRLEELFIERKSSQSHVGNIYKGRITNVEPSIQAVFVDFGMPKNGFLHISDVQPQYFPDHKGETEDVGRKIPRHNRPPIQKCFRRGQEVIVQITKEGVGTKGPTLTTYLSIPGRLLVMMPGMSRHGVSRKIEDDADRRTMHDLLNELDLPSGVGFILRTAGLGRSKRELQRDLHYLMRLWKTVVDRTRQLPAPAELYQESDLVTRTIRDVYTANFKQIIVDEAETAKRAREFLQIAMPRSKAVVELYSKREPLFHRFGIEEEIEKINMRNVPLPLGGSLVIDSTEALVAIDVNSGRFRTTEDAEETAFKINLEAAEEIARQLRLRDLGGLIVCDFIDMRVDHHKREVERALRDALKEHKERARILRMSAFGLIEMTRQRQGPSLKRNIYFDCPHCKGSGLVKMPGSVVLDVMRIIQLATHHEEVQRVTVTVAGDVAFQILNNKRAVINQIETETGCEVIIRGDAGFTGDRVHYVCEDNRGRPVNAVPSYSGNGGAAR
ncbi:MAG: Rne/Rng family ribonuclease [Phycisphaerae bacterium]